MSGEGVGECAALLIVSWVNRDKSWPRYLVAWGVAGHLLANLLLSAVFLYASARNYPGGDALAHLQHQQRFYRTERRSVHIDEFCAETGISRFLHFYPAWHYDKTEGLSVDELKQFDFLLLGSQSEDLAALFRANFSASHKELFSVDAFNRFTYLRSRKFPFYWPLLKFRTKVMCLKRLGL